MTWRADVVYGLKLDEGIPMTVKRDTFTFDPITGTKTLDSGNSSSFYLAYVIPLPLNVRQALYKAFNGIKEGYLQPGESQFIVDMSDIPAGKTILRNDYLLDDMNVRSNIIQTEEYRGEIMLLTTKTAI